jgi:chemotaxis-related protein WspD
VKNSPIVPVSRQESSPLDSQPNGDQGCEPSSCWNRVGVYGDRSAHCRNCPIYSEAGLSLLSRPLPPGYCQESTVRLADRRPEPEPRTASAVLFRITQDWLAIPTSLLQEVAERRQIHSLPHRGNGIVLGLANIRGELLICVSLAHFLELENTVSREILKASYHRLLTVSWQGERCAFPVHQVYGPYRFPAQQLNNSHKTTARSNSAFIPNLIRWQQRTVGLLNAQALFPALNRKLM